MKELNRLGGRKVPAGAPSGFVPAKYADYLAEARRSGEDIAYRHFWELCVILCLRDGLRSGDVFVPGSRRYADPATYLYTPEQWAPRRGEYCRLVGKPSNAAEALDQGKEELHAALEELEATLAGAAPGDAGMVRLDEDEHLVVPPLSAEDMPAEAKVLRDGLAGMLPFVPIASLLIELDARTGFLNCFTHAGGRKLSTSTETKRNILAVLIEMSYTISGAPCCATAFAAPSPQDEPRPPSRSYAAGPALDDRRGEIRVNGTPAGLPTGLHCALDRLAVLRGARTLTSCTAAQHLERDSTLV